MLVDSVGYILNITREIDNFFPGLFEYYNIREYDEEQASLLRHWDDTYRFINQAKYVVHDTQPHTRTASSTRPST